MIELFTADTPNGKKISIMLEEIGYEYKITKVDLINGEKLIAALTLKQQQNIEAKFQHYVLLEYPIGMANRKFATRGLSFHHSHTNCELR